MTRQARLPDSGIQTYSRDAERLGELLMTRGANPQLVRELSEAVRSQAREISDYLIARAGVRTDWDTYR